MYSYDRRTAAKEPTDEQLSFLQMIFPPKLLNAKIPLERTGVQHGGPRLDDIPNWVKIKDGEVSLTPWGKRNLWVR